MRVLLRPVLVPELGLVVLKPGRESMQVFHNHRVLVEPEPKSMRGLPSVSRWRKINHYCHFSAMSGRFVLLAALAHCLTGCYAMLNPASGLMVTITTVKPSFTVTVPARWCCAGTVIISYATRPPNHSDNLLNKT